MQTNKKFASTINKAKANGFRLCPVVPDDYVGMNLDSYVDTVQDHLHAVEEKMKEVNSSPMIFKNFPQGFIFTGALLGSDVGGTGYVFHHYRLVAF